MSDHPSGWTNVYHYHGCGGVAFVYDHKPQVGEKIVAAHVVKPAGIQDGDEMYCMACGMNVEIDELRLRGGKL